MNEKAERVKSQLEAEIHISQARDEGQAQENSRNGDGNKQSTDRTHCEEEIQEVEKITLHHCKHSFKRKVIFLFVEAVCLH